MDVLATIQILFTLLTTAKAVVDSVPSARELHEMVEVTEAAASTTRTSTTQYEVGRVQRDVHRQHLASNVQNLKVWQGDSTRLDGVRHDRGDALSNEKNASQLDDFTTEQLG